MSFLPASLFGGLNQVLNDPELVSGSLDPETILKRVQHRIQGDNIVFPQQILLIELLISTVYINIHCLEFYDGLYHVLFGHVKPLVCHSSLLSQIF